MIVNYLITKVDAKREDNIPPETQMGISNNITVLDVEKDDKFKVLKFQFRFDAKFNGNSSDELGHIVIEGFIVHTSNDIDKIYNKWQEEKVLDDSITEEILQTSLNISIIEAMSLAKMLQLPSILPLPKVSTEHKEEKKEKDKKTKN
ncbi:MAG: hypothetical protein BJBARM5_0859 [Candidatus Parvarchaeum acidophilus ARMAN-5]|jgi:hypothetical protein|uniref:Uncharacterized protein n=2 Tax=Candidatus Parvarchaeum acidophilus ARMAN-5 TaxID=662762 RepID=D6GWI2_PARA5|nr:MAG: hypothetical protein BJBARM5_0859 [Candidatus Parvarchaeum acidophilus ARMAN-5]